MKRWLSVVRFLCFKIRRSLRRGRFHINLPVLLCVVVCVSLGILRAGDGWRPSEPSAEVVEEVRKMVEGFYRPSAQDLEEARKLVPEGKQKGEELPVRQKMDDSGRELCSVTVLYLASFSMPEESLLNAAREAVSINTGCGKEIAVIGFRGFYRGSLTETLRLLYRVVRKLDVDLPFVLVPEEFRVRRVDMVPVIVVKKGDTEKVVYGDVSIRYAVGADSSGIRAGMMFRVSEPDFQVSIRSALDRVTFRRSPRFDFEIKRYDRLFSKAREDRTFCVDLSFKVDEDITLPDGRVVVPRGSTVAPPEGVSGLYAFIDGRDEREIRFALSQKPEKIIVVSGNPVELSRKYGIRFYAANDALINALNLTKTPSLARRVGRHVCVSEKRIE